MSLATILSSLPSTPPHFFDEKEDSHWVGHSKIDGADLIFRQNHSEKPFGVNIRTNKTLSLFSKLTDNVKTEIKIGERVNLSDLAFEERTLSESGQVIEEIHSLVLTESKISIISNRDQIITQVNIRPALQRPAKKSDHLKKETFTLGELFVTQNTSWIFSKKDQRSGREKTQTEKITFRNNTVIFERTSKNEGSLLRDFLPENQWNEHFVSERNVACRKEGPIIFCYDKEELVLAFEINSHYLLRYDEEKNLLLKYSQYEL